MKKELNNGLLENNYSNHLAKFLQQYFLMNFFFTATYNYA